MLTAKAIPGGDSDVAPSKGDPFRHLSRDKKQNSLRGILAHSKDPIWDRKLSVFVNNKKRMWL